MIRFTTIALLFLVAPVNAATVDYIATNLGGNTWEYSYTVKPDSADTAAGSNLLIVYFNEVFPDDLYDGLAVSGVSAGFYAGVQEPDHEFPLEGYYAAEGIISGSSDISGFSVTFDYFGAGVPGMQYFETRKLGPYDDYDGGQVISSGMTAAVVPLPAAVWLFGSGLMGLGFMRRQTS